MLTLFLVFVDNTCYIEDLVTNNVLAQRFRLDYTIPQSTVAALSSGEFVGVVADNPDQRISQKTFHAAFQMDFKSQGRQQVASIMLPGKMPDKQTTLEIYLRIKRETTALMKDELDMIVNTPGM